MYITKTIKEILNEGFEKYKDHKLCYIDDIETTYSDWDEESQAIINSPNFSWEKEHEMFGYNSPRLNLKDYPNPDYIEEKQEKYAYFTPISLDKQWGDDWNDTPFEHNAGIPYDNDYDETNIGLSYYLGSTDPCQIDTGIDGGTSFTIEFYGAGGET